MILPNYTKGFSSVCISAVSGISVLHIKTTSQYYTSQKDQMFKEKGTVINMLQLRRGHHRASS